MDDGPAIVDELTNHRPHKSALNRWEKKGIAGVRLKCVVVGRCRYTTRRMLIEYWAAVAVARDAGIAHPQHRTDSTPAVSPRPARVASRDEADEEEVLGRHGLLLEDQS